MDHGRMDGWVYARVNRVLADNVFVLGRRGRGLLKVRLWVGKSMDRIHSEPR